MGFYTTASCYRAGPHPPIITGNDLATFCQRVMEMNILDADRHWSVELKYGNAIDKDDRSTYREKKVSRYMSVVVSYDWDVDEFNLAPMEALKLLQQPPPPRTRKKFKRRSEDCNIYRASIDMGCLRDEFTTTINHELEGNCLYLGDLFFSIDVMNIRDSDTM